MSTPSSEAVYSSYLRKLYREKKLTDEQIERLERIGFDFQGGKTASRGVTCLDTREGFSSIREAERSIGDDRLSYFLRRYGVAIIDGKRYCLRRLKEAPDLDARFKDFLTNNKDNRVICIETGEIWPTIRAAELAVFGKDNGTIHRAVNGQLHSAKGLHFCLLCNYNQNEREKLLHPRYKRNKVKVRCVETDVLYDSMADAARFLVNAYSVSQRIAEGGIRKAAREGGTCRGYHWSFVDRETPPAKKRGRYRPVRCRETGIVYPSVVAAAQSFGNGTKNYSSIRLSAKSGGTAYGYHWEFEDEQAPKMKPFGRSKPVRCVETDERFESIRKAAEETGVRKSGIGQAANHKQETAGGYHWEFIEDFFWLVRVGIRKGALFVMRDMQVIWSMEFPCLLVCQSAIFIDSKRDGTEPFNGRREPRWTGRFDISSTGGAFGSVLQRARVMTETTRISAMEIRMSLANTRTPRKRSRRRKHSYRRMGTRSMTRKMASAPSSTGL